MGRFLGAGKPLGVVSRGRCPIPPEVRDELIMGLCLMPLCFMDLRSDFSGTVTCSDASESGGGVCASHGLTVMGECAAGARHIPSKVEAGVNGEIPAIGLFDGIWALQRALTVLDAPLAV